ncbi:hypothetical protein BJ742DRAFT_873207 [Cladochytrium replicatum]|nr:hypothetical protein BJ742DRAFT_873207 [Cladochytrium replicatum]
MLSAATAHSGRQPSPAQTFSTKGAGPAGSYQSSRIHRPPSTSDGKMGSEDGDWRSRKDGSTKVAEQRRQNDGDFADGRRDRLVDVKNRQGITNGPHLMSNEWGRYEGERPRNDTHKHDCGERVVQPRYSSGLVRRDGLGDTDFENRHPPVVMSRPYNGSHGGIPGDAKAAPREIARPSPTPGEDVDPDNSVVGHAKAVTRFSNRIKDYQLNELLGRGGFATVYRATSLHSETLGQQVAIKIMDKNAIQTANLIRRVSNEVTIHFSLSHHSILGLYTYFENTTHVYLVTELCINGELFQYLSKRGRLTEPEVRSIMFQVVKGVEYLHGLGIIHRDLKLSNLLLTDRFDVKIADFGLAVKINGREGEQKTMCGTPNYISPEIVTRKPYGLASDLWSLGCMFVTMLTGKPPFETNAVKRTLDKVSRVDFELPGYISPEARDLILRLLQKDPEKRPNASLILSHPFFHSSQPTKALTPIYFPVPFPNFSPLVHEQKPTSPAEAIPPPKVVPTPQLEPAKPSNNVDSLIPFSTLRLKPIKQRTRQGKVAILQNGDVILDLDGEPDLVVFSGDSSQLKLYDRSVDPEHPTTVPTHVYGRDHLPASHLKKYRYAARFVDLVRSKTPKVVFYSPQAKCVLMENDPRADFEMTFYSGMTVFHSSRQNKLEIKLAPPKDAGGAQGTNIIDLTQHPDDIASSLPPHLVPVFRHIQECLRQCTDIAKSQQDPAAPGVIPTTWPIIVKSSNITRGEQHGTVGVNAAPSEVRSTGTHKAADPRHSPSVREAVPVRNGSGPTSNTNITSATTLTAHTHSTAVTTIAPSPPKAAIRPASVISTTASMATTNALQPGDCRFLGGVGWCVKSSDGRYTLFFMDGIQLTVEARSQTVVWVSHQEKVVEGEPERRFKIDKALPDFAKEKLAHLPRFLKLFSVQKAGMWCYIWIQASMRNVGTASNGRSSDMLGAITDERSIASVYVPGMDWYRRPCFRFFTGSKPKFLAAILYKRLRKIDEEYIAAVSTTTGKLKSCSCGYQLGIDGYCTFCRKTTLLASVTKKGLESAELISEIQAVCEDVKASRLAEKGSAREFSTVVPHLAIEVSEAGITYTAVSATESKSVTCSVDDFITWCMLDDDDSPKSIELQMVNDAFIGARSIKP